VERKIGSTEEESTGEERGRGIWLVMVEKEQGIE
jgi:hypothetical protein